MSIQNDLQYCVDRSKTISDAIGLYYLPQSAPRVQSEFRGSCTGKGTSLDEGEWIQNYDGDPAATVFFGECCTYAGLVPSEVLASCCTTRTCDPTAYATCAVGTGSRFQFAVVSLPFPRLLFSERAVLRPKQVLQLLCFPRYPRHRYHARVIRGKLCWSLRSTGYVCWIHIPVYRRRRDLQPLAQKRTDIWGARRCQERLLRDLLRLSRRLPRGCDGSML